MNTIPSVRLAILFVAAGFACACDAAAQFAGEVATVTSVQGDCYLRDNAQAQPRPARAKDRLRATAEVLCNYAGSVTIQYDATPGERMIVPRWTAVGNASKGKLPGDEQRGGREAWMPPPPGSVLQGS